MHVSIPVCMIRGRARMKLDVLISWVGRRRIAVRTHRSTPIGLEKNRNVDGFRSQLHAPMLPSRSSLTLVCSSFQRNGTGLLKNLIRNRFFLTSSALYISFFSSPCSTLFDQFFWETFAKLAQIFYSFCVRQQKKTIRLKIMKRRKK